MYQPNAFDSPKISSEFAGRLSRLDPRQKVRAIVLLEIPKTESFTRPQRQMAMKLARESGTQALEKIRSIIDRFQGRLLAESPDLLGSIPVEIDPAGIRALVESESVRAVLEDQSIFLEHKFQNFSRFAHRGADFQDYERQIAKLLVVGFPFVQRDKREKIYSQNFRDRRGLTEPRRLFLFWCDFLIILESQEFDRKDFRLNKTTEFALEDFSIAPVPRVNQKVLDDDRDS